MKKLLFPLFILLYSCFLWGQNANWEAFPAVGKNNAPIIFQSKKGYWIAQLGIGDYKLSRDSGTSWESITFADTTGNDMKNNWFDFFEDDDNNIYLYSSYRNKKLFKSTVDGNTFKLFLKSSNLNNIQGVGYKNGNLFVTTHNSLEVYNPITAALLNVRALFQKPGAAHNNNLFIWDELMTLLGFPQHLKNVALILALMTPTTKPLSSMENKMRKWSNLAIG